MADTSFDYIIVGAGTAGCLLANRLSADPTQRVLLIEAGGKDDYHWIHIPVGYLYCIGNPRTDWLYQTEPDAGLNGRTLRYPRGKTLGGCSSINGMIYMRGQARDYDQWATLTGEPSWRWDQVLPVFRRHEDHHGGESAYHGAGGEWRVERQRLRWDILDAFAQAAEQAGIPATPDFNRGSNEGVGYFEVNQKRGWRWNAAKAFLRPTCYGRPNFEMWTVGQATKLLFEPGADGRQRCVGVQVWTGRGMETARAAREVLLSAGSIGSTQLLQLSGLGPAAQLQSIGITPVVDLPGVGANLQDHLQIRAVFKVRGATTLNTLSNSLWGKARIGLEYALKRSGPMSMAPSQLGAFTRSSPDKAWPDLEYHVQPLSLDAFGEPLHGFDAFTASVCNQPHQPRLGEDPLAALPGRPGHCAQLPQHRRGPPDRRPIAAADAAHRRPAGAGALRAGGIQARPAVPERRRAGPPGRRHRHHHLPPRGHRQDGPHRRPRRRSDGGGRPAPARARRHRPARGRRQRDAHHHQRQHQQPDAADRGKGRGLDPRRGGAVSGR